MKPKKLGIKKSNNITLEQSDMPTFKMPQMVGKATTFRRLTALLRANNLGHLIAMSRCSVAAPKSLLRFGALRCLVCSQSVFGEFTRNTH